MYVCMYIHIYCMYPYREARVHGGQSLCQSGVERVEIVSLKMNATGNIVSVLCWAGVNDWFVYSTHCVLQHHIASFFRGRKLSRISCFCDDLRKFSLRKSIFKQLDTALVGVVHWVTANSQKFSPRKSIFKQFAKVFSRERNSLYGIS